MGQNTKISWATHTFNAWWGCTKVGGSPACENCYAEAWSRRTGFDIWGDEKPRRYFSDKHWNEPLKWNAAAEKAGERARVFCMSMGDWAEGRPEQAPHLERLWELILNTPWLDWLMLTKRPQLITKLCPLRSQRVWQGVTAETQKWLDLRWEHLKQVDCEIYWLSVEPLFERIVLPEDFLRLGKRGWVIVGGESGPQARPMNPEWARLLRDQCMVAGVPYHFKQWGEWSPAPCIDPHLRSSATANVPAGDGTYHRMIRVGRNTAGHLLDGKEWHEFPTPVPSLSPAGSQGT